VAAVADDEAYPLGAVVGAAATQGDDGVAAVVQVGIYAVVDVGVGGVRLGAVEDDDGDAGGFHLLLDLVGHPHGRDPLVGHQERLPGAEGLHLGASFLGGTNPHQRNSGNVESERLICQCHVYFLLCGFCGVSTVCESSVRCLSAGIAHTIF
jgi:hypothetical protein